MIKIILIILFLTTIANAQDAAIDLKDYKVDEFTLTKPSIISDKVLTTEEEKTEVLRALRSETVIDTNAKEIKEGRLLIGAHLTPAKNDYIDDDHRGTVYFNPDVGNAFDPSALKVRNYSHHKVIIPDGTVIKNANFTQPEAHTDAIEGEDLTFIDCNLNNVEVHLSWTLQRCTNNHYRTIDSSKNGITYEVVQIDKNGKWEEVERREKNPL